jgi:hypothetical protein
VTAQGGIRQRSAPEETQGLCHGNSIEHAWRAKLATRHAAATASCHWAAASTRKIRSVDREMRWRWKLNVL